MEITYRTRRAACIERQAFAAYVWGRIGMAGRDATAGKLSIRRNTGDYTWGKPGITYTLVVCDSLKLSAQDFFGHEGEKIWRCR